MRYISLDVETTGLDANHNKLLTLYACIVEFIDEIYIVKDEISLKVKHSEYNETKEAMEINKINLKEHHETADSVSDACDKFNRFIQMNGAQKFPVLNQNVNFDLKFIDSLYAELGVRSPLYHRNVDLMGVWLYLVEQKKIPSTVGLRLQNMCEYFGISYEGAHDAKQDVLFVCEVYKRLLQL